MENTYLELIEEYLNGGKERGQIFPFVQLIDAIDNQSTVIEEVIDAWESCSYSNSVIIDTLNQWKENESARTSFVTYPYLLWRELVNNYSLKCKQSKEKKNDLDDCLSNNLKSSYEFLCCDLITDFLDSGRYCNQTVLLKDIFSDLTTLLQSSSANDKNRIQNRIKYFYLYQLLSDRNDIQVDREQLDTPLEILQAQLPQKDYVEIKKIFIKPFEDRYKERLLSKESFFSFSDEQIEAITEESQYCLVRSSAGSGKTAVLIARFFFLVEYQKIDPKSIVLLVYTRKVRDEINEKISKLWNYGNMEEFDTYWPKDIYKSVKPGPAKTIDGLAYEIIHNKYGVSPSILADIENKEYKSIDHNRQDILLQNGDFLNDKTFIHTLESAEYKYLYYQEEEVNEKREYVSYKDQAKPYSLRSKRETWIYEFLYDLYHDEKGQWIDDYKFKYEYPDKKTKPDFTIFKGKEKFFYEHFATLSGNLEGSAYNARAKIKQYEKQNGEWFFFHTEGEKNGMPQYIEDILPDLWQKLKTRGLIPANKGLIPKKQSIKHAKERFVTKYIKKFREARTIVVDCCLDYRSEEFRKRITMHGGYNAFFWEKVFLPLDDKLKELYRDKTNYKFTDFSDAICWATEIIADEISTGTKDSQNKVFPFTHVLVDEYQDITKSRYLLLKQADQLAHLNNTASLMAVGDDWQSIYSFVNSDLTLFTLFSDYWGKGNASCLDLSETFRFGGPLVNISKRFVLDEIMKRNHNKYLSKRTMISHCKSHVELIFKPYEKEKARDKDKYNDDDEQINAITDILKEIKTNDDITIALLSRFKSDKHKPLSNFAKSNGLEYLTIHSAKGMTFDYSIIISCNKGVFPYTKSNKEDSFIELLRGKSVWNDKEDEERRLFYVALTRATKAVYILYDKNKPSDYISELEKAVRQEVDDPFA